MVHGILNDDLSFIFILQKAKVECLRVVDQMVNVGNTNVWIYPLNSYVDND